MKKEHYNLYYIFLWEKEEYIPPKKAKEIAIKKVLDFFKNLKTNS